MRSRRDWRRRREILQQNNLASKLRHKVPWKKINFTPAQNPVELLIANTPIGGFLPHGTWLTGASCALKEVLELFLYLKHLKVQIVTQHLKTLFLAPFLLY